nr:MAG TPA: protein of unknown function (DUF1957) [Caudoviricetes sp.]
MLSHSFLINPFLLAQSFDWVFLLNLRICSYNTLIKYFFHK